MNAALRALVRDRAGGRCEYCHLHERDSDYLAFHVEHVIAKQHGGDDRAELLCLACSECNWSKGPNIAGIVDGKLYPLFNPRKQSWKRHFRRDGAVLIGRTKIGIATINVLGINQPSRVVLRQNLIAEGRFPPNE